MLWDSRSWITDYYNETGDLTTYYKGMEIGEIWGFRTAGIYASNADALNGPAYNFFKNGEMFRAYAGDLRFVDVDGDGIMTKGTARCPTTATWRSSATSRRATSTASTCR